MGKSDLERQLVHFSHDHPLVLTSMTEAGHECFGCKSTAVGRIYRCNPCNFDLHMSCSEIPLQIKHPFDTHPLILLARPLYEGGIFKCDACGQESKGFPFHCNICQTDLHPSCANLPLKFNHPNHPHTLGLSFTAPYPQKVFSCDVCNKPGKDSWHYHCSQCFFDVHVTCVNVTSQSNGNPNLPASRNPNLPASRSIIAASSPITASSSIAAASTALNSLINAARNVPTGIPQRPVGPTRPAMFSHLPVPRPSVPTGISSGMASRPPMHHPASRPPMHHPSMFQSAANIPNSSQIRAPSYQTTIYNGLISGASTGAGSYLMKMALGDIFGSNHGGTAGSGFLGSSGNNNNNFDNYNAVDFNNSGYAGSGAFDSSNSGGFDYSSSAGSGFIDSSGNYNNNVDNSNAIDFNNSGYAGSGAFDYSSSVSFDNSNSSGSGFVDSSGNYNNNVDNSNAVSFNNSGDAGSGAFDYSGSGGFDYSSSVAVDYSSSVAVDYSSSGGVDYSSSGGVDYSISGGFDYSSSGGFDASGFQGDS